MHPMAPEQAGCIFIGKVPEIHLHFNRLVFKMKEIKNTSLSNETPVWLKSKDVSVSDGCFRRRGPGWIDAK